MLPVKAESPPAQGQGRKGVFSSIPRNALQTIYHIQKGELNTLSSKNLNSKAFFKLLSQLGRRVIRNFAKDFPNRQTTLPKLNGGITNSSQSGLYSLGRWYNLPENESRSTLHPPFISPQTSQRESLRLDRFSRDVSSFPEPFLTSLSWSNFLNRQHETLSKTIC